MDYRNCDLVEVVPGRQGGAPVLRGTRVPVQAIEDGLELGQTAEELAYDYDLKVEDVRAVLAYISRRQHATSHP